MNATSAIQKHSVKVQISSGLPTHQTKRSLRAWINIGKEKIIFSNVQKIFITQNYTLVWTCIRNWAQKFSLMYVTNRIMKNGYLIQLMEQYEVFLVVDVWWRYLNLKCGLDLWQVVPEQWFFLTEVTSPGPELLSIGAISAFHLINQQMFVIFGLEKTSEHSIIVTHHLTSIHIQWWC